MWDMGASFFDFAAGKPTGMLDCFDTYHSWLKREAYVYSCEEYH